MATKKPKLTVKEQKLVAAKAAGKKNDEAWDEAGYSQNSNKNTKVVNTSKILSKPHVQEALQLALMKHGVTLDNAIAPIGKGLKALKQNEYTGEITEDLTTQLKASDRALKLMGIGNEASINVNGNATFVQVSKQDKDEFGL